jgi:hypothetical protein
MNARSVTEAQGKTLSIRLETLLVARYIHMPMPVIQVAYVIQNGVSTTLKTSGFMLSSLAHILTAVYIFFSTINQLRI